MIFVLDAGNTNIVLGIYDENELVVQWRVGTDPNRTADEYGVQVLKLFTMSNIDKEKIDGVIISSVVPNIMYSIEHMIRKYFNIKAIVVGAGVKTGINIKYDNPKSVGADRIVNAVASHVIYKRAVVIIDFGTATTFCAVTKNADYLGGAICPGLKISADALVEKAAKLPRIELIKPPSVICKNTINSMQAGIVYGYIGQVDYIVNKMKKEMINLGEDEPFVIATGGLASMITKESNTIDEINKNLTLAGLKIIYDKNK